MTNLNNEAVELDLDQIEIVVGGRSLMGSMMSGATQGATLGTFTRSNGCNEPCQELLFLHTGAQPSRF